MSSDILQMCEMLEVQTKNYIFKSFADCRGCVERALKDGAVFSAVPGPIRGPKGWDFPM